MPGAAPVVPEEPAVEVEAAPEEEVIAEEVAVLAVAVERVAPLLAVVTALPEAAVLWLAAARPVPELAPDAEVEEALLPTLAVPLPVLLATRPDELELWLPLPVVPAAAPKT